MTASAHRPVVLIIRDGWGENPHPEHDAFNAVKLARTPVADRLRAEWPTTLIRTSGEDVGLSRGTMGNSEVGHQNIGAGRVVEQEILRIDREIEGGSFFENGALVGAFEHAERTGGSVHLLGLVSDGRVHSDISHLFALIDLAKRRGFNGDRVIVHAITDGRDVGPTTGIGFLEQVQAKLTESGVGRIASVMGRYFAMDRDHRWDRTALAYRCLTGHGRAKDEGSGSAGILVRMRRDAVKAAREFYDHPLDTGRAGDEFIAPTQIVNESDDPAGPICGGDAVIFFNFRGDRPRQLTRAFTLNDDQWANVEGGGFDREGGVDDVYFCTMTAYEEGLPVSAVAFHKPPKMRDILGEVISSRGLTQFRCAETEKFAHVTYFFNDYREQPFDGERRELIPSPRDVATYDQKPKMSAPEVCEAVLRRINSPDGEPLIVVNFANGDMVGHTGKLEAAIRAIEMVDECVGRIVDSVLGAGEVGGALIVTADHGNAEQMWDPDHDCPHTAHTTFDVPLHLVARGIEHAALRSGGRLADLAPTALHLLGIDVPLAMTGRSLLSDSAEDESTRDRSTTNHAPRGKFHCFPGE